MNMNPRKNKLAVVAWIRAIGLSTAFALAFPCGANAASIFVDKNSTTMHEDGSNSAPFRTITRALEEARKIRFGSPEEGVRASPRMINLHVASSPTAYVGSFDPAVFDPASPAYDPTKEKLPLLLNIPRLKLRGETRVLLDRSGLPSLIAQGSETVVRADRPQGAKQYLVMVTRTVPLSGSGFSELEEMAGDDVTISGFWLQADPARQLPSTLIGVDGVTDFVVRRNVLSNGGMGVWTRLSSGRIEGNLAINNAVGFFLTGGSNLFPARLEVWGNRSNSNETGVGGLNLVGSGDTGNRRIGLDFGANKFARVPLRTVFDRTLNPDEVPDTLAARVVGNEFTRHPQFGIRVVGYLQDPYTAAAGQDESANVTAAFSNNVCKLNAHYGLIVDAGQIPLGDRRVVMMDVSFDGTSLEENGFGPAIFSFWRYAGSISLGSPTPFLMPNPTFAHDSRIKVCGDVTRFHYDNRQEPDPPTNPAPTNNRLTINNVDLTGLGVDSLFEVPVTSLNCGPRRYWHP